MLNEERRGGGRVVLAFVRVTVAFATALSGCAVTVYDPAVQFGVHVKVAIPFGSVIANEVESTHDAPLAGAVKSTRTLGAGRPLESNTVARIVEPFADA